VFATIPSYPRFRTLRLVEPRLRGEDVFALQCALLSAGLELPSGADGIFGRETDRAVLAAQSMFGLVVDGLAGGLTQRALAVLLAAEATAALRVAPGALVGQLEHESSFRLGIYSPLRPDGSFDAGVAQRNTAHTPAREGFDPESSIRALARTVRQHFDLFAGLPRRRRWALAQGAWNAPAFACFIAREEGASKVTAAMTARPSAEARRVFEEYVVSVSAQLAV